MCYIKFLGKGREWSLQAHVGLDNCPIACPSLVAFYIFSWFKTKRKSRNTSVCAFACSFRACKVAVIKVQFYLVCTRACVRVRIPLPLITSESTSLLISTGSSSIQDVKFLYASCESVSRQRKVNAAYHAERKANMLTLYSTAENWGRGREKDENASLTPWSWNY